MEKAHCLDSKESRWWALKFLLDVYKRQAFTRDPATGAKKLMGEYLINAQGEDVVAGVRTPSPISHLKDQMPEVYDQFVEIATRLENYFRDRCV